MQARGDKPLVVSLGEPVGIGPQLIAHTWIYRKQYNTPPFFVVGPCRLFKELATFLNLPLAVAPIVSPHDALNVFASALPCLDIPLGHSVRVGVLTPEHTQLGLDSLELSVDIALKGGARALVTLPIHKKSCYDVGFSYEGQTEFLKERAQARDVVMLFQGAKLSVALVTTHVALRHVAPLITPRRLEACLRTLHAHFFRSLRRTPRIAVAGMNPHAGEEGAFGDEEQRILIPTLERMRKEGLCAEGPYPADTLFSLWMRDTYDVALCMYHDQGLTPFKALEGFEGVNVTLGLPFVRTSPDHGTALERAQEGRGDPTSVLAALKLAMAWS